MKNKEQWLNSRRKIGLYLVLGSVVGLIIFNMFDWDTTIFYLSFGWGLGMLL